MSSQEGTIENVPEPTYKCDDAITTAYSPAWADLFEHSSEDNDQRKLAVDAETRLDIMKSWIKACNKSHCDPPCVPSKADATTWPTWLIDVVDVCIVEGSIADRYLTLSYVWGGVQTLQLSTDTIEQLRQYGSLSEHEAGLPKTIRQALEVTQLLDERYIFIDQLCIIQDDQQHKNTEIEHMAEIYANSFLTLVARAGETADSGLADDLDQLMRSNPNDHPPTYRSGRTTWERRGWTFQEQIFAARVVYFYKSVREHGDFAEEFHVSWNCHRAFWPDTDGSQTGKSEDVKARRQKELSTLTWPDFRRYTAHVGSYAPREFTYDSDVVPAFSGIVSMWTKVFPGGFLYGLPVLYFDVALLWTRHGYSKRKINETSHESIRPPSWSWMHWRGGNGYCQHPFWNAFPSTGFSDGTAYHGVVVDPLVRWFYTGAGGAHIPIESNYHKYRSFAEDSESTPPPGWSRIPRRSSERTIIKYVTPYAPREWFYFPIPLVDTSLAVTIPMPVSSKITCQTEHAFFHLVRLESDRDCDLTRIHDADGLSSGVLMERGDVPEPTGNNRRVEVIAISTSRVGGSVRDGEISYLRKYFPRHLDFYNVLWIEWIDGVAYRKNLGHITKPAWEAADRELIDVVLG